MKKVIIIGAGPAGLTAAYELLKTKEYEVVILEATDRIGGISQTIVCGQNRMDIGGHRFFSKDKRVTDWWLRFLPIQSAPSKDDKAFERKKRFAENGPDPETDDRVMLIRDRVSRIYYKNCFFDYPITLKWNTLKNMGMATTIKAGFSYLKSKIFKRKENSLEDFYINRFGKVLYSIFFEGYTEKLWGRHPRDISADWGAQRVKGLSISAVIKDILQKTLNIKPKTTETSLIESFMYPKFGPGQLWEAVADKITDNGGTILKNCKVEKIIQSDGKITAVEYCKNGECFTLNGDIFLSTMPIKDLINGMDYAPESIKKIALGLPYRDFMTVGLLVNKLKLQNKTNIKTFGNIVPDCWIYVQDTNVKLGRIQIFNNWSPYLVKDPINTIWLGLEYFCKKGDKLWNMTDQEAKDFAVSELCKIGIIDSCDVIDYHRELIEKAYPAYFDTYSKIDSVKNYLDSFENLFALGRNGQHRYNNMDHSMVTAFKAVECILNNKKDKSDIWNVNTEKEYHEEK